MIEAVVFDMDGLLIDSEYITFLAYQKVSKDKGITFDMDFYRTLLGRNADTVKKRLETYMGTRELAEETMETVLQIVEKRIETQGIPLKRGAAELIAYLKGQGIKMAVATSSNRSRATVALTKCAILQYFDVVVCGNEVTKSKPDPEIFLTAIKRLGTDSVHTIVLEDSENGIIGAHAGGIPCIHVPDLQEPSKIIKDRADYVAKDLLEVKAYMASRYFSI
ncbi:MAG: hypothetical protein PWP24_229 [Clostridiales bacterium]|nr:hypothetical protein [Clostridiales bacterium]